MAMMILGLILAAAATPPPAATPSAEAAALGARLGRMGTLAAILPTLVAKETEELVARHPDVPAAELRGIAGDVARGASERLYATIGRAYAERMSVADLTATVTFMESAPARAYKAAEPGAIAAAMQAMAGMDYKRDALAALCAKTGKACPAKNAAAAIR